MAKLPINSVGEILKQAREQKRLDLEEVNKHTKISLPVLQAMEQDDFDAFESEIYLKGFLKNYASFLQLDIDLIMGTLERQRGRLHSGKGTMWDIEETLAEEKLRSPKIISRFLVPLLLLVILILSLLLVREHKKARTLILEKKHGHYLDADEEAAEPSRLARCFTGTNGKV